ncbi:RagB/SusD family nutrient uptake outer membrane protein [Pedobacter heparinus]|uniref:RagB/SusD family nutrient uptake outer membrane protein n=1 Tax=Pedobacter heparinus TaxID=984 RepID=UPI00292EDDC5|nr:RagB/SusD family nutrient uptake outer membrane protein [Pedobacter heparinus]
MKKNIYILAVLFVLSSAVLPGCYKLDVAPQDKLNTDLFWKTPAQARQAIAAVYAALNLGETYNKFFGMDCLSDIGIGYDGAGYTEISNGSWTSRTGYVTDRWSHSYEGVSRANKVMRNIAASSLDDALKSQITAEAKFLRALFYNFLLTHFGGVPLYDETTDYDKDYMNLKKPRATAQETRDFILKDLTDAISILPAKQAPAENGRATKGAAYALRGKVYLYNKQYDLAAKDFEEIVLDPTGKGYGYQLYPDYAGLFLPGGDESSEMIFAIQTYSEVGFLAGMPYAHYMGSNATLGTSWNNVMPSVELVDSYETKDGHPFNWDNYIPGYNGSKTVREETLKATLSADFKTVAAYPKNKSQLLAMYEDRDPRMKQTIILPYTNYLGFIGNVNKMTEFVYNPNVATVNGFIVINRYKSNYLYLFRKFVPEGDMGGKLPPNNRDHVPINFPVIRYADVLLMLAECYNEAGNVNDAVKYINMVRKRPSTNMPGINSGPAWLEARDHDAVFKRIMHERAVEFPAEGLRYYDLIRWKLAKGLMNKDVKDALDNKIYTAKFEDKHYLWPIPGVETDRNPSLTPNW